MIEGAGLMKTKEEIKKEKGRLKAAEDFCAECEERSGGGVKAGTWGSESDGWRAKKSTLQWPRGGDGGGGTLFRVGGNDWSRGNRAQARSQGPFHRRSLPAFLLCRRLLLGEEIFLRNRKLSSRKKAS